MIFNKMVDVKLATLCCVAASPGQTQTWPNTGDGGVTQMVYIVHGSGDLNPPNTTINTVKGDVVDLSPYANIPLPGVTGPNGIFWIGINPKTSAMLNIETCAPGQYTANPLSLEKYLVCLTGNITVNTTSISELKFAKLPLNIDTTFTIEPNSFAAILSA